ncbi:7-carboxy-7-deazaguanine synthase QueE [Streptomyces sp. DSM 42041]|uniref:7-carboxy-7-deazaguanine synthase n=1 Tax=Streptomyces hazeniae TaxID=3075538 RepID=A0ABU2NJP3_9ACTN|nr:7-carboxy-7-deazaguanine synthase QueE [Streptomyces sp. DSM 42041]MDT0377214.1 7-carboxy-7-deazaguanine synthase QueE [Streptomyces sp. DSM 42041]
MGQLKISQVFGPTIQGEGSAAGRHCLFVRTFHCPLECEWCDTPYTWAVTDAKAAAHRDGFKYERDEPGYGLKRMEPWEVLDRLLALWDVQDRPTVIVVSGGEPMVQQPALIPLLHTLAEWGNEVHVETAGILAPLPEFDACVTQYNVSPKLASSGNRLSKRYRPAALEALRDTGRAWFKFVLTSEWEAELAGEVDGIVRDCSLDARRVMVMPEGAEAEGNVRLARKFADAATRRGYGVSFRTHVLLWGNDRDR